MLNDLEFALLGWGIKRFIERHRKVQIGSFDKCLRRIGRKHLTT